MPLVFGPIGILILLLGLRVVILRVSNRKCVVLLIFVSLLIVAHPDAGDPAHDNGKHLQQPRIVN